MPAHFIMLIIMPFFFAVSATSILLILLLEPINYYLVGLVIFSSLILVFSRSVQSFIKIQLVLIAVLMKMLSGIETQKFERLKSVRP